MRKKRREEIARISSKHIDVAVSEIDEAQHTVDHRVAKSDQGIDRAERNAVDELLYDLNQSIHLRILRA